MTRGGRDRTREGPERRCIATGEVAPAARLIRFVVGPEGGIVPDVAADLPGRGIWVAADRAALERAAGKRLFARAARAPVAVPEDLVGLVETLLARRLVELISLARKGGGAVCGYEKTRDALVKGIGGRPSAVLLQAADGSERGRAKLRPPATGPAGASAAVTVLNAAELGMAFGRDRVIHAALAAGGLATRVVEEAARLAGLRERPDGGGGQIGASGAGKDTRDA
jgi:predicted RNA-binding protein YlxR (DUF448 family)